MSNSDKTEPTLSVEIIAAATTGDPIAMTEVLQHYQKYIISLSLRNSCDEHNATTVYLDEFLRRNLETKLIEKILTFDVSL